MFSWFPFSILIVLSFGSCESIHKHDSHRYQKFKRQVNAVQNMTDLRMMAMPMSFTSSAPLSLSSPSTTTTQPTQTASSPSSPTTTTTTQSKPTTSQPKTVVLSPSFPMTTTTPTTKQPKIAALSPSSPTTTTTTQPKPTAAQPKTAALSPSSPTRTTKTQPAIITPIISTSSSSPTRTTTKTQPKSTAAQLTTTALSQSSPTTKTTIQSAATATQEATKSPSPSSPKTTTKTQSTTKPTIAKSSSSLSPSNKKEHMAESKSLTATTTKTSRQPRMPPPTIEAILNCPPGNNITLKQLKLLNKKDNFIRCESSPKQNILAHTFPTYKKEWSISFNLTSIGTISKDYGNILYFNLGKPKNKFADRWMPSINQQPNRTGLTIASSVRVDKNIIFDSQVLPLNQEIAVEVSQIKNDQSKYIYSIFINGNIVFSTENIDAKDFENVKMYMSAPWHPASHSCVNDLKVRMGSSIYICKN